METDIRYLIQQGKEFFKTQAYKKAESIFLNILQTKEFADVYNMLGVIYQQTGRYNEAIAHFQRALRINPNYTEAMLNLSVLYNDLGEYKEARDLLGKSKQALKKDKEPIDPFIKGKLANQHGVTGDLYRGVGLYKSAIEEYKKALELMSHFHDIRNRLGICLREEGLKKEALKEFQKIVKDRPTYADAQVQLGLTHYTLGDRSEARKVWSKLAQSDPKHALVRMYLRLSEEKKAAALSTPSKTTRVPSKKAQKIKKK